VILITQVELLATVITILIHLVDQRIRIIAVPVEFLETVTAIITIIIILVVLFPDLETVTTTLPIITTVMFLEAGIIIVEEECLATAITTITILVVECLATAVTIILVVVQHLVVEISDNLIRTIMRMLVTIPS